MGLNNEYKHLSYDVMRWRRRQSVGAGRLSTPPRLAGTNSSLNPTFVQFKQAGLTSTVSLACTLGEVLKSGLCISEDCFNHQLLERKMFWQRLKSIFVYLWNFRYLPLKYRWPLIKLRRRLLPTGTGLGLRDALRHARSLKHPPEPHPYLFVLRLLWPYPTWYFPAVLPAPPRAIIADPERISCQARDLMYLRSMPLWRARDTPQRAFYRLYEALCAADGQMITYETEYFWRQSSPRWATANIPDPECQDTEQYAVMASLAEVLVESFIWRLNLGLRRNDRPIMNRYKDPPPFVPEVCPSWTAKVPPLKGKLLMHPREDECFDSPLHRRNIFMSTGWFYSV